MSLVVENLPAEAYDWLTHHGILEKMSSVLSLILRTRPSFPLTALELAENFLIATAANQELANRAAEELAKAPKGASEGTLHLGSGSEQPVRVLSDAERVLASYDIALKPGWPPIFSAATSGCADAVEDILRLNPDTPLDVEVSGWTPLAIATANGHAAVVESLLRAIGAERARESTLPDGTPLLPAGAMSSSAATVEALLNAGLPVDACAPGGPTALLAAAALPEEANSLALLEKLLQHRANLLWARSDGTTALHAAAASGSVAIVAALLNAGSVRSTTEELVAQHGEAVSYRSALCAAVDESGASPLAVASHLGHTGVASILLAAGAPVLYDAFVCGKMANAASHSESGARCPTPLVSIVLSDAGSIPPVKSDSYQLLWNCSAVADVAGHQALSEMLGQHAVKQLAEYVSTPHRAAKSSPFLLAADFATVASISPHTADIFAAEDAPTSPSSPPQRSPQRNPSSSPQSSKQSDVLPQSTSSPFDVIARRHNMVETLGNGPNAPLNLSSAATLAAGVILQEAEVQLPQPHGTLFFNAPSAWSPLAAAAAADATDAVVKLSAVGPTSEISDAKISDFLSRVPEDVRDAWSSLVDKYKAAEMAPEPLPVNAIGPGGATALYLAASLASVATAEALIAARASLEISVLDGATPLIAAAFRAHAPMVKALLAAGADPSAMRHSGATALLVAAQEGAVDVVKILLDSDRCAAAINLPSKRGITPLIAAAANGHVAVIKLLLAAGASRKPPGAAYDPLGVTKAPHVLQVLKDFFITSPCSDSLHEDP